MSSGRTTSTWCSIVETLPVGSSTECVTGRLQVAADELVDLAVERRGEQQALAAGGHHVEQRGDGGHEAHVGHVVGLVEDDDLDLVELAGALLDEVGEAARGGDDDVDAALERLTLLRERGAADDRADLQADRVGERLERVADLGGELAGRDEDEAAGALALRLRAGEAGEQRQAEGERLAGAGPAAAEDVGAGERVAHRRGLDRERGARCRGGQRGHEVLRQAELEEAGDVSAESAVDGVELDGWQAETKKSLS